MRALVTGGAGFIGSHIVRRLLANGYEVRVLDSFASGRRSNLEDVAGDVELTEADVRDAAAVGAAARGCDHIFHFAGIASVEHSVAAPAMSHEVNVTGTLNVLSAARDAGAGRLVLASSALVYGAGSESALHEGLSPLPSTPLGVATLAAESYARSFGTVYGLETVALRFFNVFGPHQDPRSQYAAVIPRFIWGFRHGEPPTIFGDGEQRRDFTYVENAVNASLLAAAAPDICGGVYNIGSGQATTVNELAACVREELGATVDAVHGPERAGELADCVADISSAQVELGYEPAVLLEEGVRRTVEYFVAEEDYVPPSRNGGRSLTLVGPGANGHHANGTRAQNRERSGIPGRGHIFISGGAGFIGSHLTEALLERGRGERIVILDDLSTGSIENIQHLIDGDRVTFVRGSVTDADLVDDLMHGAVQCIHLASAVGVQMIVNEPLETLMRSVRGSNVVMHSAMRNRVRVLFSSTSEVYGKQSHNALTEEDDLVFGSPAKGRWTYAIAKTFGEALIHGYHRQRGADATVVRLFNTVGPRQTGTYGMVLPRFVRQALRGEDLTVYGDGQQTRCFTHVGDSVAALMLLSENQETSGRTFNIGSSTPIAVIDLAERVIARANSSSSVKLIPYEAAFASGFEELGARRPDTSALSSLTGWKQRFTVDDAIDDVIAHERAQMADEAGLVPPSAEGVA